MKISVYRIQYYTITRAIIDTYSLHENPEAIVDDKGTVRVQAGEKIQRLTVKKGVEISRTSPETVTIAAENLRSAFAALPPPPASGTSTVTENIMIQSQVVQADLLLAPTVAEVPPAAVPPAVKTKAA